MAHAKDFPSRLGYLAYALAILLVLTYLGRLVILTPTSPLVLIPAALTGFIANLSSMSGSASSCSSAGAVRLGECYG